MLDTLRVNSQVSESLSSSDSYEFISGGGYYYDYYELSNVVPGNPVTVSLTSNNFDTFLELYDLDSGTLIGSNNNGGAGTNSQITFTPQVGDAYAIGVSSAGSNSTGSYTVGAFS